MTLFGHEGARAAWKDALEGERMHHAWLLAGKAGLGKMQFALAAARELVGGEPEAAQHPDIHVLTNLPKDDKEDKKREEGKPYETKRNIAIAQIRTMQQRLNTRPTLGEQRAIVIDPADDMERSASNALLKSLEEPPRGTYFLLVSHRPSRLLPTIRSRCRTLRFTPLPDDAMQTILNEQAPDSDPATRAAAIAAAAGSPGRALGFIDSGLGPVAKLMRRILAQGDAGFVLRGELAASLGARPDRAKLEAALDLARSILDENIETLPVATLAPRVEAHAELVRLTGELATYNYDPGLLAMEIGTLLAGAAPASERANV
ncbi:MAG: DNA polymerase III subunit delta' [Erythrobacter sp.]|nr:DNA polymerase III subunit delta' [Erythrobacter sp.]